MNADARAGRMVEIVTVEAGEVVEEYDAVDLLLLLLRPLLLVFDIPTE
jgi:hypothetical protein